MKKFILAALAVLFAMLPMSAQEVSTIQGRVLLKQTGGTIAGATVYLLESGAVTSTDQNGSFVFRGLSAGRYHIAADMQNVLRTVSAVIDLPAGQTVEQDLSLQFATQRTEVTVSVSGRAQTTLESFQSTHSLNSLDLARAENLAAGLGEALGNQPGTGISQRSFGPGSSRPLIRGFDGDRVLIMNDDVRTGSISASSGDHGETFNPLTFEKLEVVKGPATLLYGSNAMGGIVNAITGHAGFGSHADGIQGYLQGGGGTANALGGAAAGFEYQSGHWRLWAGGGGQRTGDYNTPIGTVENSRTRTTNGYGGFGWFGDRTFVSFGFRAYNATYGIPFAGEFHGHHHHEEGEEEEEADDHEEHEELRVDLEMNQQAYQVNWGLRNLGAAIDNFVLRFNYATYRHDEVELEEGERNIGTRFDNDQSVVRGVFEQAQRGRWTGRFGFWGMNRNFEASGEEALSPPVEQNAIAFFALEELDFERAKLQFGARVESNLYKPAFATRGSEEHMEEEGEEIPDAVRRRFTGASAAAGIHLDLWRDAAAVANFTHSYRAPALEELYNFGPHIGTLSFEVGDPRLKAETGNGADLSLRQHAGRIDAEWNVFYYRFRNFVFPFATGEEADGLPVVNFVQRDSRFVGSEARLGIGLRDDLTLNLGADFVDAQDTQTNTALPRIPPLRGRIGFDYKRGGFSLRPELVLANRQSQTFTLETPTAGYAKLDLNASYTIPVRHGVHQFSVSVFNVGDRFYRNHSSFIKDLAPEMGRGVRFSYIVRFF